MGKAKGGSRTLIISPCTKMIIMNQAVGNQVKCEWVQVTSNSRSPLFSCAPSPLLRLFLTAFYCFTLSGNWWVESHVIPFHIISGATTRLSWVKCYTMLSEKPSIYQRSMQAPDILLEFLCGREEPGKRKWSGSFHHNNHRDQISARTRFKFTDTLCLYVQFIGIHYWQL